eukprot:TRINITY_DN9814_c0_g2_i2.p1 TRINITY_DN9814_c0_g2~~TRINITY_DN9814_c0_g2_i2.p1  ORF type:complete len:809 (-),score=210.77 TRINITY_DN9814_c0_g2_i2:649-3075(-)
MVLVQSLGQSQLTSDAADEDLHYFIAEQTTTNVLHRAMSPSHDSVPWSSHRSGDDTEDALRHRLLSSLVSSAADGTLDSALASCSSPKVQKVRTEPSKAERSIDDIRNQVRGGLEAALAKGTLDTLLATASSTTSPPCTAGREVQRSDDGLEGVRHRLRYCLEVSADNGQLDKTLQRLGNPGCVKKDDDIDALKRKVQDMLADSAANGSLEHAMKEVAENRIQQGEGTDARPACFSPDTVFSARMTPDERQQPAAWSVAGESLGNVLLQGVGCTERTPGGSQFAAAVSPPPAAALEDAEQISDELLNTQGSWDVAAKTLQCMTVKAASGSPVAAGPDLLRELRSPAPWQQEELPTAAKATAAAAPSPCLFAAEAAVRGLVSAAMLSEDGRSTVADASGCQSPVEGSSSANTSFQLEDASSPSSGQQVDKSRPPGTPEWSRAQDFAQQLVSHGMCSPFTEGCERSTMCDVTPEPCHVRALEEARMKTHDVLTGALTAGILADALRDASEESRRQEEMQGTLAKEVGAALDAASHEHIVATLQLMGSHAQNKLRQVLQSEDAASSRSQTVVPASPHGLDASLKQGTQACQKENDARSECNAMRKNVLGILENGLRDGSLESALSQQASLAQHAILMKARKALELAVSAGGLDRALQKAFDSREQTRERVAGQLVDADRSGKMDRGVEAMVNTNTQLSQQSSPRSSFRGSAGRHRACAASCATSCCCSCCGGRRSCDAHAAYACLRGTGHGTAAANGGEAASSTSLRPQLQAAADCAQQHGCSTDFTGHADGGEQQQEGRAAALADRAHAA